MGRILSSEFEDKRFQKWIDKFKIICGITQDKELSKILEIAPTGYGQMKKNNRFPYEKIVLASIKRKISLDNLFAIKTDECINTKNINIQDNEILSISNNDCKVVIPYVIQNENKTLRSFVQDNIIYIVDISLNIYTSPSVYIIKSGDSYFIKKIKKSLNDSYILLDTENNIEPLKIDEDKFKELKIIGKVTEFITFEISKRC